MSSKTRRTRAAGGRTEATAASQMPADEIQDAYLKRAIAELAALNDEITASAICAEAGALPVLSSGSPQAEIVLVKWTPSLAERQEGVAFFGRAGSAILKSVQRLGIEPLDLYGTLCVKCPEGADAPERYAEWLSRELQIVSPKLIVPMGPQALAAVNGLGYPLAEPIGDEAGARQRWTPAIEAIYVPDIDESLDEQGAKRRFWDAFRQIGEWHAEQPPY